MNLTGINHFPLGGRLHCLQCLLPALLLKLLSFDVFRQRLVDYPAFATVEPAGDRLTVATAQVLWVTDDWPEKRRTWKIIAPGGTVYP